MCIFRASDIAIAANEPNADLANEKDVSDANASDPAPATPPPATDADPFPKSLVIAVVFFSVILLLGTFILNKNRER